jgi:hypothetical protein
MTPIVEESLKKGGGRGEHERQQQQVLDKKKDFWENELRSLGIEPLRQNELNDKAELQALAEIIKQVYYQDYKTAYSSKNEDNKEEVSG